MSEESAHSRTFWNKLPKRQKAMVVGAGVAVVLAASFIWNHGKAKADEINFVIIVSTVLVLLLWVLYRVCAFVLPSLPRIMVALAASVALNCVIGVAILDLSRPRLVLVFLAPWALVMSLFDNYLPDSAFLIGGLFSLLFYTVVVWLILWAFAHFGGRSADKPRHHSSHG